MPASVGDALSASAILAAAKGQNSLDAPRYLVSSALAGLFVGVAVVLLLTTSGPMAAAGAPSAKLVGGAVFGIALTLVVFAGGELFTGNVMYMVQGLAARTIRPSQLGRVWGLSLLGNLLGSVGFAAMVSAGGTLNSGATATTPGPAMTLLTTMIQAKAAASSSELFWRAVLCNMLVCLALWMAARASTDGAKLVVMWWGLLAFIAAGFEHSIANATIFSLAGFAGIPGATDVGRNLLLTVSGNIVGGGVLVGMAYAWLGSPSAAPVRQPVAAGSGPPGAGDPPTGA